MPTLPTPSNAPAGTQSSLGQQARLHWVRGLCKGLPGVAQQLLGQMEQQAQAVGTAREMQERREAWSSYRQHQAAWLNACMQALQGALQPGRATPASVPQRGALQFELLSDDVVENKILASRMALAMGETTAPVFDTLRLRMQAIENQELPSDDILRSESVCRHLVEQWLASGLQRGDLFVYLLHALLHGIGQVSGAYAPRTPGAQVLRNARQPEPQRAGHGDEHHLAPGRARIVAVAIGQAPGLEQARALVVAQRVDGDARELGEFGDQHVLRLARLVLR